MALVEIKNLKKYFYGPKGAVHAVDDVTMSIDAGETPCQDASTIVSCVSGEVVIARYGALSEDDIQRVAKTARMRISGVV